MVVSPSQGSGRVIAVTLSPSQPSTLEKLEVVLGGGGRTPWAVTHPRFFLFVPGDMTHELVRHFLIETSPRGVKLKGCPNEPNFGELSPPPSPRSQACPRLPAAASARHPCHRRSREMHGDSLPLCCGAFTLPDFFLCLSYPAETCYHYHWNNNCNNSCLYPLPTM